MPGIIIAGTHSGCGKTTVSAGIMAALVKRGLTVQPFKVGPDFIDPMFHTFITGRNSRNLDSWFLDELTLQTLYAKNAVQADISVIEGVMGLYDGFDGQSINGSTAHVAKIIKSPVILVVDGAAMSLSIAALIKGFQEFDPDVPLKGVILNNIDHEAHYQLLREIIVNHLNPPVLGYLPKRFEYTLGDRHLGLIPCGEVPDFKEKIDRLAIQVEKTIDLDLLLTLARQSKVITPIHTERNFPSVKYQPRIAVAKDQAFNFYYADNLDLLQELGAELVYFSPLEESRLPERIHGLYIGGGFPEVWAANLQENLTMRREVHKKISEGLPTYAECGGLMYLTESITQTNGTVWEMVGIIPGKSEMTLTLQRFGYVDIQIQANCIISKKGASIKGHEFHFSKTEVMDGVPRCYRVRTMKAGQEVNAWDCGFKIHNMLAGYAHLHFWNNIDFAKEFVRQCAVYSQ